MVSKLPVSPFGRQPKTDKISDALALNSGRDIEHLQTYPKLEQNISIIDFSNLSQCEVAKPNRITDDDLFRLAVLHYLRSTPVPHRNRWTIRSSLFPNLPEKLDGISSLVEELIKQGVVIIEGENNSCLQQLSLTPYGSQEFESNQFFLYSEQLFNNFISIQKILRDENNRWKNNPAFKEHVANNLWANRRQNGWKWHQDVFEFISDTYAPWLGDKGLLQSDIKDCDPKLYAQLHKQLTALSKEEKRSALDSLQLPSERDASLDAITDPRDKIGQEYLRKRWREDQQAQRDKLQLNK